MRGWRGVGCIICLGAVIAGAPARADPLPTIVTFELSKAKDEASALARNPKGFWIGQIVSRLEAKKPILHRKLEHPVTVAVSFVVDRAGKVVSKEVARSSGNPAIDNEALAVLDRAAPFPPMPAALSEDHLAFTMPLRFK